MEEALEVDTESFEWSRSLNEFCTWWAIETWLNLGTLRALRSHALLEFPDPN
jgi:hypothetical protein